MKPLRQSWKCPPVGKSFVGFKNVRLYDQEDNHVGWGIVKLFVPAKAERFQGSYSKKIRVSEAKVISIRKIKTRKKLVKLARDESAHSHHDYLFVYKTKSVVSPTYEFSRLNETCASGIHLFMNLTPAINYGW